MKSYIILIFSFFASVGYAQLENEPGNPPMHIMGYTDGNTIKLRWAVLDAQLWDHALNSGFIITRQEIMANGQSIPYLQQLESKITLAENYKALPESEWDSQFPGDDYATAAKELIYSDEFTVEITGEPTLADAIEQANKTENKLTFSLLVANNDYEVAKAMALGFEDNTAQAGIIYEYRVILNQEEVPENFRSAFTHIGLENTIDLPPIPVPVGATQDKKSVVSWDVEGMEAYYTSYNIERSEDGINFQTCNDQPYIWTGQEGFEESKVYYADSLADNQTHYYYRVRGCTPFGVLGPPSDVIQVKGIDPPIDLPLAINATTADESSVTLSWEDLASSFNADIDHFDILVSEDVYGPYEKINTSPLPSSERVFTDTSPKLSSYYRLHAQDINGHEYQSNPVLVQLIDKDPPAVPAGINGYVTEAGKVVLKWDENTEKDLLGYRVLYSNSADGDYIQLTSAEVLDTKFEHTVDPNIPLDSIYLKVISVDLRKNYSAPSPVIALERPDITPPAKPNLHQVAPTPEGVKLKWDLSEDADIVKHELQRKPKNAPGWETLLSIPAGQEDSQFTDMNTERREYRYRLIAVDDRQNQSSSDVVDIVPYDSGIRGEIDDFKVHSYKETENGKFIYAIKLSWKYPLDHMLMDFQVYRSKKGSNMRLYKTVPLDRSLNEGPGTTSVIVDNPVTPVDEYWKWTEEGMKDRGRYIYQVIARYKDGSSSAMSRAVMVKL